MQWPGLAARGGSRLRIRFAMVNQCRCHAAITEVPRIAGGPEARQDLHRHEHDQSNGEPRSAAKVRERGATWWTPRSPQRDHIAGGKLSVNVGGRRETFEKVKPLSSIFFGPKVLTFGDNGLALSMKIAVNLSLAVQMLAFSEGVLLARRAHRREHAVDVMVIQRNRLADDSVPRPRSSCAAGRKPGFDVT